MRRDPVSPAWLFDVFTGRRGGAPEGLFDVVALPGERLETELGEGDLVIRRALGEGGLAQIVEAAGLYPGARLPLDQIVLRPFAERFEEQAPPAPDSTATDRFIAAHSSRYCTPGQAGSATCRSLASPRPVRRVVIHVVAVPTTSKRSGVEAVIAGWQRSGRQAGAHYLVDRDGTVTQMIRENDAAFHTPGNNADSIGIEHADVCNDPAPLTTRLYERSAALVRDLATRHGFAITDASVSGHRDVNPNHGDPGPYWDWEYYRLLLAWDGTTQASRPVRVVTAAVSGTMPSGWQTGRRRDIPNSHCAGRRDPWGATYWKAQPSATGTAAELTLAVDEPGTYSVSLWWPDVKGANPAATVEIETTAVQINQRQNFGRWNAVGTVTVGSTPAEVRVRIRRDSPQPGWILCDGVRLLRIASAGAGESEAINCEGPATMLDRFANDSSALTADHRAILARLAREIVDSKAEGVCLVGHADTRGADAYNLQLAEKRAANAEAELRKQIDALSPGLSGRITFDRSSRGESTPVAGDDTPEGRARNRRVEITLRRGGSDVVTTRTDPAPEERGLEALESFAEQVSPASRLIPVGTGGARRFVGTGKTPLGTPAYTWSILDPKIARVSPDADSQAHPNPVTVFGLRPGQTTLRQVHRSSRGSGTDDTPIVVVEMKMSLLGPDEPAAPIPEANELVRPAPHVANPVAERAVLVRLEPASFFSGKTVEWAFLPDGTPRGTLPAGRSTLAAHGSFSFTPAAGGLEGSSVVDAQGRAAVRVSLPAKAFNRGRIVAGVQGSPWVSERANLEVPGIVVVDPGHGGSRDLCTKGDPCQCGPERKPRAVCDSSRNNAHGTSGTLEKELTLAVGLKVRNALMAAARLVKVFMTRDCDVNVGGVERAELARCKGADVFVSIHFNGSENQATRGTATFVRADANGNVNRTEDVGLAQRIQNAMFRLMPAGRRDLGVLDDTRTAPGSLAVLNDINFGNTPRLHPVRSCLLEVDFLSNDDVDRAFNTARDHETLRTNVGNAIANAILDDLANQ